MRIDLLYWGGMQEKPRKALGTGDSLYYSISGKMWSDEVIVTAFDQPITSYEGGCAFLESFIDYEQRGFHRDFAEAVRLDVMSSLLVALDNPQQRWPAIHIAGTKGKGSVAAMMEAALREAGYATGLYTSPHLVTVRERVRIDGQKISPAGLIDAAEKLRRAVAELEANDLRRPTFFEVYTALAFRAFADAQVDIAIVEAGLGGRLDATNVITPSVTVITSIDLDHTHILGTTVQEIAAEKAGIIKPTIPVVIARQAPEVYDVLAERAAQVDAPLSAAPDIAEFGQVSPVPVPEASDDFEPPTEKFVLATDTGPLEVQCALAGCHQADNAATAYAVLKTLADYGFAVSSRQFQTALAQLQWPARFQVAGARPWLIIDCAHNPASARALISALRRHLEYDGLTLVVGISADKDVKQILSILCPAADQVIVTQADNPRALAAEHLAAVVRQQFAGPISVAPAVSEAVELAGEVTTEREAICITGSFFVAGEAMKHLGLET